MKYVRDKDYQGTFKNAILFIGIICGSLDQALNTLKLILFP